MQKENHDPDQVLTDLESGLRWSDTPRGIFTVSGHHFQTTVALIEDYAGQVLEIRSLDNLIALTETWLKAPAVITIWLLPVLLLLIPIPFVSAALALVTYLALEIFAPGFASPGPARVVRILDNPVLQVIGYAAILGVLAAVWEAAEAVVYGLSGFGLLRWRVIQRIAEPFYEKIRRPMYPLPVPDTVLRSMITRTALRNHIPLEGVTEMEKRLLDKLGK